MGPRKVHREGLRLEEVPVVKSVNGVSPRLSLPPAGSPRFPAQGATVEDQWEHGSEVSSTSSYNPSMPSRRMLPLSPSEILYQPLLKFFGSIFYWNQDQSLVDLSETEFRDTMNSLINKHTAFIECQAALRALRKEVPKEALRRRTSRSLETLGGKSKLYRELCQNFKVVADSYLDIFSDDAIADRHFAEHGFLANHAARLGKPWAGQADHVEATRPFYHSSEEMLRHHIEIVTSKRTTKTRTVGPSFHCWHPTTSIKLAITELVDAHYLAFPHAQFGRKNPRVNLPLPGPRQSESLPHLIYSHAAEFASTAVRESAPVFRGVHRALSEAFDSPFAAIIQGAFKVTLTAVIVCVCLAYMVNCSLSAIIPGFGSPRACRPFNRVTTLTANPCRIPVLNVFCQTNPDIAFHLEQHNYMTDGPEELTERLVSSPTMKTVMSGHFQQASSHLTAAAKVYFDHVSRIDFTIPDGNAGKEHEALATSCRDEQFQWLDRFTDQWSQRLLTLSTSSADAATSAQDYLDWNSEARAGILTFMKRHYKQRMIRTKVDQLVEESTKQTDRLHGHAKAVSTTIARKYDAAQNLASHAEATSANISIHTKRLLSGDYRSSQNPDGLEMSKFGEIRLYETSKTALRNIAREDRQAAIALQAAMAESDQRASQFRALASAFRKMHKEFQKNEDHERLVRWLHEIVLFAANATVGAGLEDEFVMKHWSPLIHDNYVHYGLEDHTRGLFWRLLP